MRISAPSFIIPAGRVENVLFLRNRVDEVELLYMDSMSAYDMPDEPEVKALAETGMRFNVHMPYDRDLSEISEWNFMTGFADRLKPLNAVTHTFHIQHQQSFFENLEWFLKETAMPVTLENSSDDVHLFDMMEGIGAGICLDVGHIVSSMDTAGVIAKYADRIEMFHLHGVRDGKDHQSIRYLDDSVLSAVFGFASEKGLTVSLEVFNEADLRDSLETAERFI